LIINRIDKKLKTNSLADCLNSLAKSTNSLADWQNSLANRQNSLASPKSLNIAKLLKEPYQTILAICQTIC
jgi:hypothetical protein